MTNSIILVGEQAWHVKTLLQALTRGETVGDSQARLLLVANPGGHLQQLRLLDQRLPFDEPRLWVTASTPQTRSMLKGEDVLFVPDIASRAYGSMAKNVLPARRLFSNYNVAAAVSTGSGLALPYLATSARHRIPTHYIESATRTDGPSLTGKLLRSVPGVRVHTQHRRWANRKWGYAGSVFDGFAVEHADHRATIDKVVVSLGTSARYGFRRLLERLVKILPPAVDVLWQTGCTDVSGLPISAHKEIPSETLADAMSVADVVIAHAGTGIALAAFQSGRSPVLVPREHRFNEHVDDHQFLTASLLHGADLAVVRRVDELDWEAVAEAARRRVLQRSATSVLDLG